MPDKWKLLRLRMSQFVSFCLDLKDHRIRNRQIRHKFIPFPLNKETEHYGQPINLKTQMKWKIFNKNILSNLTEEQVENLNRLKTLKKLN